MSAITNRRLRVAYLVGTYLFLFMAVARAVIVGKESAGDALVGATLAVLITMICVYDAAVLGRPWAMGVRFSFLIFWPLAVPVYIIRSRGWWGCVVILLHAGVLFVGMIVCVVLYVVLQIRIP